MSGVVIDGGGKKNDGADSKNRLELIPPCFTGGVGQVLTFGAEKYGADNWMRGIFFRRLIGGIKRHVLAIERGEDRDPESGLLHHYHIGWGAAFLAHYVENFEEFQQFDDRVFSGRPNEIHIPSFDPVPDTGKVPR